MSSAYGESCARARPGPEALRATRQPPFLFSEARYLVALGTHFTGEAAQARELGLRSELSDTSSMQPPGLALCGRAAWPLDLAGNGICKGVSRATGWKERHCPL